VSQKQSGHKNVGANLAMDYSHKKGHLEMS
jgi:hypothetical protein